MKYGNHSSDQVIIVMVNKVGTRLHQVILNYLIQVPLAIFCSDHRDPMEIVQHRARLAYGMDGSPDGLDKCFLKFPLQKEKILSSMCHSRNRFCLSLPKNDSNNIQAQLCEGCQVMQNKPHYPLDSDLAAG